MKEWGKQVRWFCIIFVCIKVSKIEKFKLGFLKIRTLCKLRSYFVESESSLKNKPFCPPFRDRLASFICLRQRQLASPFHLYDSCCVVGFRSSSSLDFRVTRNDCFQLLKEVRAQRLLELAFQRHPVRMFLIRTHLLVTPCSGDNSG